MKRNKKTGEIVDMNIKTIEYPNDPQRHPKYRLYNSLAELNDEWEDYEGPKEYWYIAELCGGLQRKQDTDNGEDRFNKEIGNYFETEEEAEKAVEKLKAWKRLKDKGFEFRGYTDDSEDLFSCQVIRCRFDDFGKESRKDLDLLFGGEE